MSWVLHGSSFMFVSLKACVQCTVTEQKTSHGMYLNSLAKDFYIDLILKTKTFYIFVDGHSK